MVFMNISDSEHVNPTLPIVRALRHRGCHVTYFVDSELSAAVEAAGASWRPFRRPGRVGEETSGTLLTLDATGISKYVKSGTPKELYEPLFMAVAYDAEALLPATLEDMRMLTPPPSILVYDPFIAFARVVAYVLHLPAVGMLTMWGPGAFHTPVQAEVDWESHPWVDLPRRAIFDKYGFDIFHQGMPLACFSPLLNLVSAIEEFYIPPHSGYHTKRFGSFPFKLVGFLRDPGLDLNSERCRGASNAAVVSLADGSLKVGKRVIYIELGKLASSPTTYGRLFGSFGSCADTQASTNQAFVRHVLEACFAAFGSYKNVFVVLSSGHNLEILEGSLRIPKNFLVRQSVPEREVLRRCIAFFTEGGACSVHEALTLGVPMAIMPMFGDQVCIAEVIEAQGAGICFRDPLQTVTAERLRAAYLQLLDGGGQNPYRQKARDLSVKIRDTGGVNDAVESILAVARVKSFPEPGGQKCLLGRLSASSALSKEGDHLKRVVTLPVSLQ